ncbi:hypothetical protein E8E13_006356 [Curvularia kusanoi]|uniref:Uncharacterized protein n=1 Tax=Curvularia kusanoi TaxID=90978 RepID=A0A9P4TED2_CURKU|nr:hypothetical protein E8E13_006356 [Curvularia kusanoi]
MGFNSPRAQFTSGYSNRAERPPPHSISALRSSRSGGKSVPKKYRKYHKKPTTTKKKEKRNIFSRAVHFFFNAIGSPGYPTAPTDPKTKLR